MIPPAARKRSNPTRQATGTGNLGMASILLRAPSPNGWERRDSNEEEAVTRLTAGIVVRQGFMGRENLWVRWRRFVRTARSARTVRFRGGTVDTSGFPGRRHLHRWDRPRISPAAPRETCPIRVDGRPSAFVPALGRFRLVETFTLPVILPDLPLGSFIRHTGGTTSSPGTAGRSGAR